MEWPLDGYRVGREGVIETLNADYAETVKNVYNTKIYIYRVLCYQGSSFSLRKLNFPPHSMGPSNL